MSFGSVFLCILGIYAAYYGSLIIYETYFNKEGELVDEIKPVEDEIDVSDENRRFTPTEIFVPRGERRKPNTQDGEETDVIEVDAPEDFDEEEGDLQNEEDGAPIQMNEGYSVNQVKQLVNEYVNSDVDGIDSKLSEITCLYKNLQ